MRPPFMDTQPTPIGRGLTRKLARQQREAALMATPREAVDLDRLHTLTRLGAIPMPEASRLLTAVIAGQHKRREAA